ncbi:MAG TPA: hypothetical protein VGJ63_19970 [Micromonosporaceae bacterium]
MEAVRRIVVAVLTAAALAGTYACDSGGSDRTATPPARTPSSPARTPASSAPTACPAPAVAPVAARSILRPGPTNGLTASTARADTLVVEAAVLDPSCRPAAGATVRVWHTDARGLYGPAGTEACCYYGGTVTTDADGRFRLDTIRPAQYPGPTAPPPHIHLEIRHPAGALETEIIFAPVPPSSDMVFPSRNVPVALRPIGAHSWYAAAAFVLEP